MENKRKWLNIFKEQEKYILVGPDKRANNYFMIVAWLLIFWDTFFWFNFEHLNNIYDSSNFLNSTASFNFHLFLNAFYDCFLSRFLVLNPFHVLSLPFSSNIPYINYLFEPAGSLDCYAHNISAVFTIWSSSDFSLRTW